MPIKDFYNATSLEPGDVLVCTITAHVAHDGSIRVYRCPYPNPQTDIEGVPQGSQAGDETTKIEDIFPIIKWTKESDT